MSQAQEVNPDAIRRDVIKDMLKGSTARNPNSILGTVLADFNAQGNTELAVSIKEIELAGVSIKRNNLGLNKKPQTLVARVGFACSCFRTVGQLTSL